MMVELVAVVILLLVWCVLACMQLLQQLFALQKAVFAFVDATAALHHLLSLAELPQCGQQ